MSADNVVAVAATEIAGQLDRSATLEARAAEAMRLARGHWLVTDDDGRFKAACVALYMASASGERARLEREFRAIAALSAMVGAQPLLSAGAALDTLADAGDALGLAGMWAGGAE